MFYQQDNITDIQLGNPKSITVNKLLDQETGNITSEAMLTFWLNMDTQIDDIKLTLTSWYKKRYKTFLLHFGTPITEIMVENNKVEYFLDMGVGGSGFTYRQILEDFFANIENKYGNIIEVEVFFL